MSEPDFKWPAGRYLVFGFVTVALLVFGLGGWAAVAPISGAVVAPGMLEVKHNRQIVQHPDGGVVDAILARDGDMVEAGDVLIRFESEKLRAEFAIVEEQYFELLARKNRLAAESDGLAAIVFNPELVAAAGDSAGLEALLEAQFLQFKANRSAHEAEQSALVERIEQIRRQIDGLAAIRDATVRQAGLLRKEVATQEILFARRLSRQIELLTPQRELARIEGTEGQVEAAIAESRARIAETEIEMLRLGTERRKAAIAELRDLKFRDIDLRERRTTLREEVANLDLRAPVSGIVHGSIADTLRAVIRPAEPIMFIVPKEMPLVVRVHVEPVHIDRVFPGQPAILRFPAFNARLTPEIEGEVVKVSADVIHDNHTGESYYRIEIRLAAGADTLLSGQTLLPGMPVEAFLQTEHRTPLSYLLKPLTDFFTRAFRET